MNGKRPLGVIVVCIVMLLGSGVATAASTTAVDGASAGEAGITTSASASITFNDQTSDGAAVDIASYDLGDEGETIAIWSTSNGSADQLLGTVSPESKTGAATVTLDASVSENQTLVAVIHSGPASLDNILTLDTAEITIETVPASITFNDQTSNGRTVDIASYELGDEGETIAIWSVSNGSADQLLGSLSPPVRSGSLSITPSPILRENQTLVAAVHSGEPTIENVLAIDTAAIVVDLNPSLGDNPPARNVDSDPLLEDVNGDYKTDIFDAITLYNNRNRDAVQQNADKFNFDGNNGVDLFDAIALYNEVSG